MQQDIVEKIEIDFSQNKEEVREKLLNIAKFFDNELSEHLQRCILFLSKRDLDELNRLIELLRVDYRDVIYWAEYDDKSTKVNDFTKPFDSD